MTTSRNLLDGRPLIWADNRQRRLAAISNVPLSIYDPRPGSPEFYITCVCCTNGIRVRKRWDDWEEKMRFVTPRVHSCRCGARILLYRHNSGDAWTGDWSHNDGEVVYRHLGAYEAVDPLEYRHDYDSWKYYDLYKILDTHDISRQNTLL